MLIKGSAVLVWERGDYIKEANSDRDSDVYEKDTEPLISTIHRTIEKIRKIRDLKKETFRS